MKQALEMLKVGDDTIKRQFNRYIYHQHNLYKKD
jgi:hypothetical protein